MSFFTVITTEKHVLAIADRMIFYPHSGEHRDGGGKIFGIDGYTVVTAIGSTEFTENISSAILKAIHFHNRNGFFKDGDLRASLREHYKKTHGDVNYTHAMVMLGMNNNAPYFCSAHWPDFEITTGGPWGFVIPDLHYLQNGLFSAYVRGLPRQLKELQLSTANEKELVGEVEKLLRFLAGEASRMTPTVGKIYDLAIISKDGVTWK